ncbi:MAG: hypothetical protein LBH05_09575 [Deferribacteraceae bacterium]|jgi:phosphomannomutase|nr:hypothetical protein [Deferribacteraceae bacterium]
MKECVSKSILGVKDKLFKGTAYDIRAYVGEPGSFFSDKAVLTPESMRIAGVLMGSLTLKTENGIAVQLNPGEYVSVGYDNGPTSKDLAEAFSKGLTEQGINVFDLGIASSGQVYHNQTQFKTEGHVQITRSHVEVTTNGAKFAIGQQGIHTYLLKQMNDALLGETIGRDASPGVVYDKTAVGRNLYYAKMIARYGGYFKENPRKLAINLFGGTGLQYKELFQEIFGKDNLIILGDNINVNEGHMLADPTRKEMLEKVPELASVLEKGLRVHSFDLDADRGSLTEGAGALSLSGTGHYLGDDLAFILADYKLSMAAPKLFAELSSKTLPQREADEINRIVTTVIVDPRFTSGIRTFVEAKGGSIQYHRKGHSLWKETMMANMSKVVAAAGYESADTFVKESGYRDLQIEASLHMFASDSDDGIVRDDAIENVFLLEKLLDDLKIKSLKDYFAKVPRRFATKEIRTNSKSNEIKEAITYDIVAQLRKAFAKYNLIEFDGQIRAEWDTGFIMYGMSNTSPKLTMMVEECSAEERNEALAYIMALHNEVKSKHGDDLPMDTSENAFFIEDNSYEMKKPDSMDKTDPRAETFRKKRGII